MPKMYTLLLILLIMDKSYTQGKHEMLIGFGRSLSSSSTHSVGLNVSMLHLRQLRPWLYNVNFMQHRNMKTHADSKYFNIDNIINNDKNVFSETNYVFPESEKGLVNASATVYKKINIDISSGVAFQCFPKHKFQVLPYVAMGLTYLAFDEFNESGVFEIDEEEFGFSDKSVNLNFPRYKRILDLGYKLGVLNRLQIEERWHLACALQFTSIIISVENRFDGLILAGYNF